MRYRPADLGLLTLPEWLSFAVLVVKGGRRRR